jgi:hypothetical protein
MLAPVLASSVMTILFLIKASGGGIRRFDKGISNVFLVPVSPFFSF